MGNCVGSRELVALSQEMWRGFASRCVFVCPEWSACLIVLLDRPGGFEKAKTQTARVSTPALPSTTLCVTLGKLLDPRASFPSSVKWG